MQWQLDGSEQAGGRGRDNGPSDNIGQRQGLAVNGGDDE